MLPQHLIHTATVEFTHFPVLVCMAQLVPIRYVEVIGLSVPDKSRAWLSYHALGSFYTMLRAWVNVRDFFPALHEFLCTAKLKQARERDVPV